MANEIDLVVGQKAFDRITELLTALGAVDTKFGELSTKFAALGSNTNTVKSTADLAKLTAENAKLNAVIEQQIKDFADLNEKLAKVTVTRGSATKGITEETIAQRELNKETTLNIKATTEVAGAYAKLDAQHKLAVKSAQDLAASTGRGTIEYEKAKLKANELGQQLKVIDTDIGKHTRNVGNYSSSWNGLGNSINQLTREAPAFANSVQTGFMALSNNIPILTDELGVLIQKNKDLQAEGKPTQSILKTVAGAFFSWQTAISLGVTILTVYGAKLVDMAMGLGNVQKALKSLEQAQKDSDERISNTTRNIEAQTAIAIANAKMRGASQKELDDLTLTGQKDKLLNLQKERDLAKNTYDEAVNYRKNGIEGVKQRQRAELDAYNQSVAQRRKAGEEVSPLEQMKVQRQMIYKNEQEIKKIKGNASGEAFKTATDNYIKTEGAVKTHGQKLTVLTKELQASQFEANEKANKKLDKLDDERAKAEKERIENQFKGEIADLETKKNTAKNRLDLFKGEVKDKLVLSMNLASKEIDLAEKVYEYNVFLAEKDKGLLSKATSEKTKDIENAFKENIERAGKFYSDFFKKADDALPKSIFGDKYKMTDEQKADLKAHEDLVKKTADDMKSYLGSFGTEFASKAGFSETFNMLSGNIAGFGTDAKVTFVAVAESAQEMFNMIAESSAANYDAEYARLDAQKNEAIKNAGDSTAAKEKIDADYEKKKKEIQLREFKAKQKITIANIAIDTAQAIVSTYAQVPKYDFGVSATTLAFIIAGLGAAQIGMVASQKPPAYADGTDNHSGGLMLVNDGAGSNFQEKVILPSGKVIRPQGRNVLMDAPKGTKVLNHEQQLFEMLQSNNISMSSQQASGLTYDEMNEIFQNNFANIKTQNTIFDKNGFQSYVRNGNSITRSNSNRSQAIGISV
jgi:hypothetical protein